MTDARTRAARLRGVLVGASAGAVAVAGHGVGGAALPAAPSIVLMVLLCAAVGALASSSAESLRRPIAVLAYVSAGQLVGHCTLVFASTHSHANHWSASMLASHAAAAIVCAALICTAERMFAALAGVVLWRLIVVLFELCDDANPSPGRPVWARTALTSRILAGGGLGTRGPPLPAFAA